MIRDLTKYGLNITAFGIATTIGGMVLYFVGRRFDE